MTDPGGSDANQSKGKGWPDVLLALPLWLIALAFFSLVSVVVFSLLFSHDIVKLGFLGDWGRSPQADHEQVVGGLPKGAVVAFASDDGCPSGWLAYPNLTGRMIIGAGQGENLPKHSYLEIGGSESQKIATENLPPNKIATNGKAAIPSAVGDQYNAGGHNGPFITASTNNIETDTLGRGLPIATLSP